MEKHDIIMENEKDINDVISKVNLSGAMVVLKEASDRAIDSASINNEEIMRQIERDNKTFRIFSKKPQNSKNNKFNGK